MCSSDLVYERPLIASAQQARAAGGLADMPLLVLTAGRPHEGETPEEQRAWIDLQAGLARLSTRGRQEVVRNSGHMIPFEAPEAVIEAAREVVANVRTPNTPDFRVETTGRAVSLPPQPSDGTSTRPTR